MIRSWKTTVDTAKSTLSPTLVNSAATTPRKGPGEDAVMSRVSAAQGPGRVRRKPLGGVS
ncbi:hypothetical protein Pen01_30050 [Phytomonospora endophytica]|nr:hypothetical protein Pen01_30050 [Phytomonospora endophytica]